MNRPPYPNYFIFPRFFFQKLSVLVAGFCLSVSCHPGVKTPPDTLVVGIESAPASLDPRRAVDAYALKLSQLLHDGLFRLNERMEVVPDLAESYEFFPPTRYVFHLRPGVRFHHGKEFSAEDVKYTLESIRDPALASPFRGVMDKVRSVEILDPRTVQVDLKETYLPFLSALTMGIVPAPTGPGHPPPNPSLGTGPFRLLSFRPSEEVVMARNDDYFRGAAKMPKLRFRVIPDDNLRVLELKNRRIDVLQNNVPPLLLNALKDDGLTRQTTEGINMSYLGLNVRKGPLADPRVRRALAHAIDIPALIDYRMAGLARPASGLLARVHWAYEGDVVRYGYDAAEARRLLDEAGFPDPDGNGPKPRFTLTYKTSSRKDRVGLARIIARYLKEVGIGVEIVPYDWGIFFHDVNAGNFDLFCLTWVGLSDPDIFHDVFHSSRVPPAGVNRGGYRSLEVDRLTDEGRVEIDRERRQKIYSDVQKVLARDLPIVPLWHEDNYAVFGDNVKGLRLRPNASFEWAVEVYK